MPTMLQLKKREEAAIKQGRPWIYSNQIDTKKTPMKGFEPGQSVTVIAANGQVLGRATVNPHTLIAARLYSRDAEGELDAALLTQRITAALRLREAFYQAPYYRLVFSEGDFLPGLIIDRFGDHFVVQLNTAGMDRQAEAVRQALIDVFPRLQSILLRNDSAAREVEGLPLAVTALHGTPPTEVIIIENETQFAVPIWKGAENGLVL